MEITRQEVIELMRIMALKYQMQTAISFYDSRLGDAQAKIVYDTMENKGKIYVDCRENLDEMLNQIREDDKKYNLHEWKR